jgi:hypothetical protein
VRLVKGITLNSNLYTRTEESVPIEDIDDEPSFASSLQVQSSDASTIPMKAIANLNSINDDVKYTGKSYQRRRYEEVVKQPLQRESSDERPVISMKDRPYKAMREMLEAKTANLEMSETQPMRRLRKGCD